MLVYLLVSMDLLEWGMGGVLPTCHPRLESLASLLTVNDPMCGVPEPGKGGKGKPMANVKQFYSNFIATT